MTETTTTPWEACKAVLRSAIDAGYGFYPAPRSELASGWRENCRIHVYAPGRADRIGTGEGKTWTAAAWAALAVVERDQKGWAA